MVEVILHDDDLLDRLQPADAVRWMGEVAEVVEQVVHRLTLAMVAAARELVPRYAEALLSTSTSCATGAVLCGAGGGGVGAPLLRLVAMRALEVHADSIDTDFVGATDWHGVTTPPSTAKKTRCVPSR